MKAGIAPNWYCSSGRTSFLAGLLQLSSSTDSSAVMHYIIVPIFVRVMKKSGIPGSFFDKIGIRHNILCTVCDQIYSRSKDQLGKFVDPACGQLNRENTYFPDLVRV